MSRTRLLPLAAAVLAFSISACASKSAKKKGAEPVQTVETPAVKGSDASVSEVNIRGTEFGAAPELAAIFFDYDRYGLSEAARNTLAANADYLKKNKDFEVLAEGHCDERGTIEYNLALGQKRAKAVRDYYLQLGLPAQRIGTLSYGEEKPSCKEPTEDCWAKNRRSETKVRARTVQNGTAHPEGTKTQ